MCKTSANAGRLSRWHLAGTDPRKTSLPYRTTGTGSQRPVMPSQLFSSLELRSVRLSNRIVVAPMCQYSATDGSPGDWHLMHLGHLALAGPGLLIAEATGVSREGRITPDCTGLYSDANEAAFARAVSLCQRVSASPMGIQLAHAGRKASTRAPWLDGGPLTEDEGAWTPVAPSALPYLPNWDPPAALDDAGLESIRQDFSSAAQRAVRIGFKLIEVHAAHGYLLHTFLSPLTNRRRDRYGGNLAARMRFPLEVFEAVRSVVPGELPVTLRLSATDWMEEGWDVAQSVAFARELKALGCDLVHVSSGGLVQEQKLRTGPGYQTGFARDIRNGAEMPVMACGQITSPVQAETILRTEQADLVALARAMLWDPRWVWRAAVELGEETPLPPPYARAHPALAGMPFVKRN